MSPEEKIDPPASGMSRWLLLLVVAAGIGLLIVVLRRPEPPLAATREKGVGQRLASVHFEPLLNTDVPLALDDLQGKVVLVNFWGPWCPPCLVELPELLQLEYKYRERDDVEFVLVSSSGGNMPRSPEALREETLPVVKRHNVSLPIYHDQSQAAKREVNQVSGFLGFPTTLVLDRQGRIRGVWRGYHPTAATEMKRIIDQSLAGN